MVTLRQLFQTFGHDPQWQKFAAASIPAMTAVYLRKLGDRDVESLTPFDFELQEAASRQPEERRAKARACLQHMTAWAKGKGYKHPQEFLAEPEPELHPEPQAKTGAKVLSKHPRRGEWQLPRREEDSLDREAWLVDERPRTGTITFCTSSRGWKDGKRVMDSRWRAEITIAGQRYRYRGKSRRECSDWLKAVIAKRILPTDTSADWLRAEQHKDEEARTDELIVTAAEEANIVYEYRQTGDTEILYDYCIKALLPHMVWYCCHTLRLSREQSLSSSRQAVGLILTNIVSGRPVTNITFTCKRMLRTYRSRGDFWYYEKAPEQVRLMVNRIDMTALSELYKVTKDRRL